jgi:hypothetical protein
VSRRPIEQKKRRRVSKALRRKPLPAYFDLVQFLIDQGHARTKRDAKAIIMARRVKANSHTLGVEKVPVVQPLGGIEDQDVLFPHVPVDVRKDVLVSADEVEA